MSTVVISGTTFSSLKSIYVRPSLLEFGLSSEKLKSKIGLDDANLLSELNGRKANKLAKRWAPLIIHNALIDANFPANDSLAKILGGINDRLAGSKAQNWTSAFREASIRCVPPSAFIKSLSKEQKLLLNNETKDWRKEGEKTEEEISKWIIQNRFALKQYFEEIISDQSIEFKISLKKLSKFKPSAE